MALAVLFTLFLFSVPVLSQTSQGTIQGVNTNPVSAVIPGFKEGLKLMPVGSTWQLFIPPQLAYGERGAGNVIPSNATLILEVELPSIKGTGNQPAAQ